MAGKCRFLPLTPRNAATKPRQPDYAILSVCRVHAAAVPPSCFCGGDVRTFPRDSWARARGRVAQNGVASTCRFSVMPKQELPNLSLIRRPCLPTRTFGCCSEMAIPTVIAYHHIMAGRSRQRPGPPRAQRLRAIGRVRAEVRPVSLTEGSGRTSHEFPHCKRWDTYMHACLLA